MDLGPGKSAGVGGGRTQMELPGSNASTTRPSSITHKTSLPIFSSQLPHNDLGSELGFEGASQLDIDLDLRLGLGADLDLGIDIDLDFGRDKAREVPSHSHSRSSSASPSPTPTSASSTVEFVPEFDPERLPGGKRWKGKEKEVCPPPEDENEGQALPVDVEIDDRERLSGGSTWKGKEKEVNVDGMEEAMEIEREWPFAPSVGSSGNGKGKEAAVAVGIAETAFAPSLVPIRGRAPSPVPVASPTTPASPAFHQSFKTSSKDRDRSTHNAHIFPARTNSARMPANTIVTTTTTTTTTTISASGPTPFPRRDEWLEKSGIARDVSVKVSALDPSHGKEKNTDEREREKDAKRKVEKEKEKERRRLPLPPVLNLNTGSGRGFGRLLPLPLALPLASSGGKRGGYAMPASTVVTVYSERTSNVPFLNIPPPPLTHLPAPPTTSGGKRSAKGKGNGKTVIGNTITEKPPLPPIPPSFALPIYRKHAKRRTSVVSAKSTKSTRSVKSVRSSRSVHSNGGRSTRSGRSGNGRKVKRRSTNANANAKKRDRDRRRRTGLARIVLEVKRGGRIAASVEAEGTGSGTGTGIYGAEEVREILERLRNMK